MMEYFKKNPFGLNSEDKKKWFLKELNLISEHHYNHCEPYRRIVDSEQRSSLNAKDLSIVPFLAIQLFKKIELKSIEDSKVQKIINSSGTTGQSASQIFLDLETSRRQSTSLVKILQSFIGKNRRPLLIIDHPSILKGQKRLSARAAGIIGLKSFGKDVVFALNDNYSINTEVVESFLKQNQNDSFLIFGFTFMIWKYLYLNISEKNQFNFSNGTLIHSGGWKKLKDLQINNNQFKKKLEEKFEIKAIHNFYGMAEQVGSVYVECEFGRLHVPITSDIIIRDPITLDILEGSKVGLVQVFSLLPSSYPGHSLLTEDLGFISGEDNCSCGRNGKTIEIIGRLEDSELRGCSDTYEFKKNKNISNYKILSICKIKTIDKFLEVKSMQPFDDSNKDFVNQFSKNLFVDKRIKRNSELLALAYWMRSAQIKKIEKEYLYLSKNIHLAPRGILFHIAPSNVDTMFVYSWVLSLLCGNKSIIKISNKETANSLILLNHISKLFKDDLWKVQADQTIFVRYPNNYKNNKFFTDLCQMRIVWGGDVTIKELRECALPINSKEIIFSDKFSQSVFNAKKIISEPFLNKIVRNFANDTFNFQQLACSSPRLVVWVGNTQDIKKAKILFWEKLEFHIETLFKEFSKKAIIEKLVHAQHMVANGGNDITWSNSKKITRMEIKSLNRLKESNHPGMGFFYEKNIYNLSELPNYLSKKGQTLTQYGFNKKEIKLLLESNPLIPLHRVVEVGEALAFSHIWDGYSIIDEMTKKIDYK